MKWIEHTLSLYPGSQAVFSLFSLFKAFIHNFLFSPFFKTLGKQYRANGFSQSLQFPLVMQLPAGWWWVSQISKDLYLIGEYYFYNQWLHNWPLALCKSVDIIYKFRLWRLLLCLHFFRVMCSKCLLENSARMFLYVFLPLH